MSISAAALRERSTLGEGLLGGVGPVPGVVEGLDLGGRLVARGPLEQHVVAGVRVGRRVEVDEVDRRACDAVAQERQIVAVVEVVGHGRSWVAGRER